MKKSVFVLMLCALSMILGIFYRNSPAVIAVELTADLGLNGESLGLISASTMVAYGMMQLPGGLLSDVFGGRKVLACLSCLAGLAAFAFALSASPAQAITARFALGIGAATTVPLMTFLAKWFSPGTYGRAFSIVSCLAGLGVILAASPMVVLSAWLTWRGAVAVFACISMALGLTLFFAITDQPSGKQSRGRRVSVADLLKGVGEILSNRRFWPLAVWQMTGVGIMFTLLSLWWVPYLVAVTGCSTMEASYIMTVGSVAMIMVQPLAGYVSDVVWKSRVKPTRLLSIAMAASSLVMVLGGGIMPYYAHMIQAVVLIVACGGTTVLVMTMVKETFPAHQAGTALGCFNTLHPLWTGLMQTFFGVIYNWRLANGADSAAAYQTALILVLVNMVVALVCSFKARETFPAEAPPAPQA